MQDELYIRVKQALTWLKRNKGILQKDIADKMGMAESSFTRALARCKEKNDEDFIISFHSAVKNYISIDFLLHGEGKMLTVDGMSVEMEKELKDTQSFIDSFDSPSTSNKHINKELDQSSLVNAAIAAKDDAIESLKRELLTTDELIQSLRDQIAEKDARIAELKDRLVEYRRIIDAKNGLADYPFHIGTAEADRKQKHI